MIFQHTWQKVLDGSKTQTRRIFKENWQLLFDDDECRYVCLAVRQGKYVWKHYSNQQLSVQPGRGKKGIAHIVINRLRREDVRNITDANVQAEGFNSRDEFMQLWRKMHGDNYDALVIEFELVDA